MTLIIFLIFVPLLAFVLLAVNLVFAPHNPYQEKSSAFECGFHSFLGQNRTQFNISFFIFALLFLLFDLEIILVYPYIVSGYLNGIYGLVTMLIFLLVLTLGFVYELGKNALKLENRQTYSLKQNITEVVSLSSYNPPKPHLSLGLPLNSDLNPLNLKKYIISPLLQNALQSGMLDPSLVNKNHKGLYLVMFRIINQDSRVLVYNYIHYHDLFNNTLISYMVNRVNVSNSTISEEWGNCLVIIEDSLILNRPDKEYEDILNNLGQSQYLAAGIKSLKFADDLTAFSSYETIYDIINLAYNKDHKHYDVLFNKIKNSSRAIGGISDKLPNLIDGCLFIVEDLDLFINNLKNKNSLTNCGPQSLRGKVNSINSFLSCLDLDFRSSLYFHNDYHIKAGNIDARSFLSRDRLSFKNIHINIGKLIY